MHMERASVHIASVLASATLASSAQPTRARARAVVRDFGALPSDSLNHRYPSREKLRTYQKRANVPLSWTAFSGSLSSSQWSAVRRSSLDSVNLLSHSSSPRPYQQFHAFSPKERQI